MTPKMLTRREVAEVLGVEINTVDVWRTRPASGFPEPDGYLGSTPWWKPSTIARFKRNRNPSGWHGQLRNRQD